MTVLNYVRGRKKARRSVFLRRFIKYFILMGVNLVIFSQAAGLVGAASDSLAVFPPIIKVRVRPAAQVRQPIRVFNQTDSDIFVVLTIKVFDSGTLMGQPIWNDKTNPPDWVKIIGPIDDSRRAYKIKRQSFTDFLLVLQPPSQTPSRDWYFTVLFKSQPASKVETGLTTVQPQIGVNVLVTVNNKLKVDTQPVMIEAFEAPWLVDSFNKYMDIKLQLFNQNQVWVEALPVIKLAKIVGLGRNEVFNLVPINLLSQNKKAVFLTEKDIELANDSGRVINKSLIKSSPISRVKNKFFSRENYKSAKSLRLYTDSFRFGIFNLEVEIINDNQVAQTSKIIVFIPKWFLVGFFVILIFVFSKKFIQGNKD